MRSLARALGADVPACLARGPVDDRNGVDIARLDSLPAADIILINPRIALPTDGVCPELPHNRPRNRLRRPI